MKRIATFGAGVLAGYAYAFVSALVASKFAGSKRPGPHPPGTCAEDCPWPEHGLPFNPTFESGSRAAERLRNLDGSDMHDVLPTDDELDVPAWVNEPGPWATFFMEQPAPPGFQYPTIGVEKPLRKPCPPWCPCHDLR